MIFLLKNTVSGDNISLSERKEYIVGRKNCDILLENDQSISREHAIIRVKDDHVTLEDCKSKYHTLRNGVQVSPRVEIKLEHMDSIQFGVFNSRFCFEAYRFITAASALSAEKKNRLKENISTCKGKYVEKWSSSCTHLTVDKITLTIKFLQALIDEKPIVIPEYWSKYAESIQNKTAPPDVNKYNNPPVAEPLLSSDFQYNFDSRRKTLFYNKLFVFLKSNTKKQMEDIIKSCGGDCMSWEEEGPKTSYEISTSAKEHLIIRTDDDEENISFNAIVTDLVKQRKRTIPLNEIALAIVHRSCEINCNPDFNKVTEVFGACTQKPQTMNILATETQSQMVMSSKLKTQKVIPSSVEDDWALSVSGVREIEKETAGPSGVKRPSADQDKGVFKKPKTEEEENKRNEKEIRTRIENDASVTKKSSANNKVGDHFKNKPLASQKRKADEDIQELNSKNSNPFSFITVAKNKRNKSSDEINPFELTRASGKKPLSRSKSPASKHVNPFAQMLTGRTKSHNITIEAEEMFRPKKEIKLVPIKSDTPYISSIKRSFLNTTWLDKSTASVKKEVKEEDSELLQFAEAFKNCVNVKTMSVFIRNEQSKENLNDVSFDSVDGKKNFKKFKKVKPVKPQVTIIPRTRLTKIASGSVIGIVVSSLADSDDGVSPLKQKGKKRVKKFVL